jgi:aspartyl-tRNA(Asn)/glutamyl-tRNA(Gln) amidotransferase subunit C
MNRNEELGPSQVRHVAALARLAVSDEELGSIERDLKAILHHVDRLRDVDVDGVEPLHSPHGHCSRLHDDVPAPPLSVTDVTDMAPAREGDYIAVPKVLDGGGAA